MQYKKSVESVTDHVVENFRNSATCDDGEVDLFRKFANSIISTQSSKAIFIEETHGAHKANVEFYSKVHQVHTRCEIADLLLVVVHPRNGIRATFLQAKRRKNGDKYKWGVPTAHEPLPMFDFRGQFNQWELLATQRDIQGVGSFNPPSNLLSGAASCAIGSMGVFYCDNLANVEVVYSIAKYITASTKSGGKVTGQTKMLANLMLRGMYTSSYPCVDPSVIVTTSMQEFASQLFHGRVGSPVCLPYVEANVRKCLPYPESSSWVLDHVDKKLQTVRAIRQGDSIRNDLEGRGIDSRYYRAEQSELFTDRSSPDIFVVWSRHGVDEVG